MRAKQLFGIVRNLEVPHHTIRNPATGEFRPVMHNQLAAFTMAYPDGTPCIYVEMYMLDIASRYTIREEDGGSLKSVANSLTSLLRFCWLHRFQPWEITDDLMKEAIHFLKDEPDSLRPHKRKRNNNTIDRYIDDWISFFTWLQNSLFRNRLIVGPPQDEPQVPLTDVITVDRHGKRRVSYMYRYTPASSTPEPKRPISREIRKLLWDAVSKMSDPDQFSPFYKRRFTESALKDHVNFIRRRRELLLELLEATGARPSELANISLSKNIDCAKSLRLVIPTRKRKDDFERSIPIDRGLAIRIELFIKKYRQALLTNLSPSGNAVAPSDRLFISHLGRAISGGTFEKEFSRIVLAAEIRDQQACMSMFRHRFITQMVKLHLLGFMDTSPGKTRHMMTESDYRTVLTKVAAFTGHKDEQSLLHYIDMAWEEIGIFDYVKPAQELIRNVEQGLNNLSRLKSELKASRRMTKEDLMNIAISEIESIRNTTYAALQAYNQADRTNGRM